MKSASGELKKRTARATSAGFAETAERNLRAPAPWRGRESGDITLSNISVSRDRARCATTLTVIPEWGRAPAPVCPRHADDAGLGGRIDRAGDSAKGGARDDSARTMRPKRGSSFTPTVDTHCASAIAAPKCSCARAPAGTPSSTFFKLLGTDRRSSLCTTWVIGTFAVISAIAARRVAASSSRSTSYAE